MSHPDEMISGFADMIHANGTHESSFDGLTKRRLLGGGCLKSLAPFKPTSKNEVFMLLRITFGRSHLNDR